MVDINGLPDARLRVSAQQRDHAAGILREAMVDGRLQVEELEARLPSALNAFTRADIYRVLEDLVPADQLPGVVAADMNLGEGEGMSWENPLLIRAGWQGHEEMGEWDLPPFLEILGTGYGTVTLNCVQARALAKVIDVVITGNASVHIVVPEGWGVDVQQLNVHGAGGQVLSQVPTRPVGDNPRLILRGSTTYAVKIREPNWWDLRRMRKHRQKQIHQQPRPALPSNQGGAPSGG